MPFDGNGNWTSNFSAVADRNANIKIEASRFDNILLADIAQSFETCLTKDMQVKPQQNFDANNFRIINVADPATGSDAVNLSTLNTKDGTAVHKSGTETITGDKTWSGSNSWTGSASFSNTISGSINGNAETVTNGVYTTGNQTVGGNKEFSGTTTLSGAVTSTGNITSSGTNSFSGTNNFTGNVSLGSSATATTPASATDSSTKVATTAWVAGHRTTTQPTTTSTASANAPSYVVENYKSSNGRWYIVFSDGFIIQGGPTNPTQSTFNDDTQFTVTLNKAFTSTDYTVLKNIQNPTKAAAYHRELCPTDKTTTSFKTYASGGGTSFIAFGY